MTFITGDSKSRKFINKSPICKRLDSQTFQDLKKPESQMPSFVQRILKKDHFT